MNLDFFDPISEAISLDQHQYDQLGLALTQQADEHFEDATVCLIGVEDKRYGRSCSSIRRSLYSYFLPSHFPAIYDLGNIRIENDFFDTADDFYKVIAECLERNITLCFFGGGRQFLYELQQAYAFAKRYTNIGLITSSFVVQDDEDEETNIDNFLYRICASRPSYLFQISQLAHQRYLVDRSSLALFKEMNFEAMRLGKVRDDIQETEPILRDVDILNISTQAIKQAETGGQPRCSPNGLYSEEVAQLCKYAGVSDNLSSVLFNDYDSLYDTNGACAQLIAQSIWCFMEGVAARKAEFPHKPNNGFTKYTVHNAEMNVELLFVKSEKTGRWWIEMPKDKALLREEFFLPCTFEDYQTALDGDIPERWLRGFNKLNEK